MSESHTTSRRLPSLAHLWPASTEMVVHASGSDCHIHHKGICLWIGCKTYTCHFLANHFYLYPVSVRGNSSWMRWVCDEFVFLWETESCPCQRLRASFLVSIFLKDVIILNKVRGMLSLMAAVGCFRSVNSKLPGFLSHHHDIFWGNATMDR